MSEGKGKLAGRVKSTRHKTDSNPGGSQEAGLPFVHFKPGVFRHSARYEVNGTGERHCSRCGEKV
jgi:hypothetical protein